MRVGLALAACSSAATRASAAFGAVRGRSARTHVFLVKTFSREAQLGR